MNWTFLNLKTPIPEIPKIVNANFTSFKRYLDGFFDGSTGILTVPLETTGKVKASRGEFVTSVVDNLIVKSQFTNLYENYTTADKDFYYTFIGPEVSTRIAHDSSVWPYENPIYAWLDVNKPNYKMGNTYPLALQNDNLSQVVRVIFNRTNTLGNFQILLDPCSGSIFSMSPSDSSIRYLELICIGYDPSWGPSWTPYKFGLLDASSSGSGGGGTVGPGTTGRIPYFNSPSTIGDSIAYQSGGNLHVDGSIYERTKLVGVYDPCLNNSLATPADIGGIPMGTTVASLRGKYIEEILNEILFPTVLAYIGTPNSALLSGISASTQEVGTALSPMVSGIYNQGLITNGDETSGPNLTGSATIFSFEFPDGTIDASYNASGNTQAHAFTTYDVSFGTNIWQVTVNYATGFGTYYDNKGNASSNLNASRMAGSITSNSATIAGRMYTWRGYGSGGSAPVASAGVRALVSRSFLGASNTGTFDITIPALTQEVYFFVPTGHTVVVQYVESSFADVTGSFITSSIGVDDAGANSHTYDSWVSFIGVSGYPSTATYRVTIT